VYILSQKGILNAVFIWHVSPDAPKIRGVDENCLFYFEGFFLPLSIKIALRIASEKLAKRRLLDRLFCEEGRVKKLIYGSTQGML
jgi:hypothetical protein